MYVEKYVRAAVENNEQYLTKSNQRPPTRCKTPVMSGYWLETDTLPKLKAEGVTQYNGMVKVLRWSVELGRVGILLETSLMSMYLALPCRGHLEQLFHMFRYLKVHPKRKLSFNPQHTTIDECLFAAHDWYNFYWDAKEAILEDSLTPRGNLVSKIALWILIMHMAEIPGYHRPGF